MSHVFDEILDVEVSVNMSKLCEASRLGIPSAYRGVVYRYLLGVTSPDMSSEIKVEKEQDKEFEALLTAHGRLKLGESAASSMPSRHWMGPLGLPSSLTSSSALGSGSRKVVGSTLPASSDSYAPFSEALQHQSASWISSSTTGAVPLVHPPASLLDATPSHPHYFWEFLQLEARKLLDQNTRLGTRLLHPRTLPSGKTVGTHAVVGALERESLSPTSGSPDGQSTKDVSMENGGERDASSRHHYQDANAGLRPHQQPHRQEEAEEEGDERSSKLPLRSYSQRLQSLLQALAALQVYYSDLPPVLFAPILYFAGTLETIFPLSIDTFLCARALYRMLSTPPRGVLHSIDSTQLHCGKFLMLFRSVNATLYHHFFREHVTATEWVPDMIRFLFTHTVVLHVDERLALWDYYLGTAAASVAGGSSSSKAATSGSGVGCHHLSTTAPGEFRIHVFVCLALLLEHTEDLLECDREEILRLFLHLPRVNVAGLLRKAVALQETTSSFV